MNLAPYTFHSFVVGVNNQGIYHIELGSRFAFTFCDQDVAPLISESNYYFEIPKIQVLPSLGSARYSLEYIVDVYNFWSKFSEHRIDNGNDDNSVCSYSNQFSIVFTEKPLLIKIIPIISKRWLYPEGRKSQSYIYRRSKFSPWGR